MSGTEVRADSEVDNGGPEVWGQFDLFPIDRLGTDEERRGLVDLDTLGERAS